MASILFPDFTGTIAKIASVENAQAQRDWLDEDRAAKKEIAPLIPKALQGDKGALDQIGARHPDTFTKILPMLDRMDVAKRAKVKEDAEFITTNGMAILNAAPEAQPGLYERVRREAQAAGRDVSQWPTTYDPGWVKFNVDKAMPVAEYYKKSGEGVQYVDGGGQGGPAPGGFTGQVAKDESGGNYNIPNAKGSGAYGKYQFMPETWANVAQANPNLKLPMNMRQATPQQQEAAMEALTRSNGQALQTAGVPATPDNLYLAHRFGVDGTRRFLSAPDNTPIAQVFPPKWIEQNPDLNTTVGQFKRGVQSRYGGITAGREVGVAAGPSGPGPQVAQGDNTRADGSGNPLPPVGQGGEIPIETFKGVQLPPGYRIGTQGGKIFSPVPGYVQVMPPGGGAPVLWPVPKVKEPGADKGLFGDSLTGRALTALRTLTPDQQDYAAAYAILSKPQVVPDGAGGQTVIQPMDLSMFPKPAYGAAGAPAPAAGPTPAGGPVPTPIPGGGSMVNIPGKGKPLDNSARDDLTKASSGVLELTELVKSFDSSFGGYMLDSLGDADNFRKRNLPDMLGGKDEKGQAQWWQRYQQFANLERNKLFGAALTPGEAAEFNKAMINPGMKPDQITANLARQRDVATKALSRIVNSMVAQGANREAIEAATGIKIGDLPSAQGGVPQAPPPAPTPPPATPKPPQGSADRGKVLFDARDAIAKGADPAKVRERLRTMGIEDEP